MIRNLLILVRLDERKIDEGNNNMKNIKEILHTKRTKTEEHIKQLQQEGREGIRYTAKMPDIPFLVLGLVCDVGWMIHLAAGIIYFCSNGFHYVLDWTALLPMAAVLFGVVNTSRLNRMHEKEIATKLQKDLSFGLTIYAGLAACIVGIVQIMAYTSIPPTLRWMIAGGFINFVSGLPIYLSFRKGIVYGVQ